MKFDEITNQSCILSTSTTTAGTSDTTTTGSTTSSTTSTGTTTASTTTNSTTTGATTSTTTEAPLAAMSMFAFNQTMDRMVQADIDQGDHFVVGTANWSNIRDFGIYRPSDSCIYGFGGYLSGGNFKVDLYQTDIHDYRDNLTDIDFGAATTGSLRNVFFNPVSDDCYAIVVIDGNTKIYSFDPFASGHNLTLALDLTGESDDIYCGCFDATGATLYILRNDTGDPTKVRVATLDTGDWTFGAGQEVTGYTGAPDAPVGFTNANGQFYFAGAEADPEVYAINVTTGAATVHTTRTPTNALHGLTAHPHEFPMIGQWWYDNGNWSPSSTLPHWNYNYAWMDLETDKPFSNGSPTPPEFDINPVMPTTAQSPYAYAISSYRGRNAQYSRATIGAFDEFGDRWFCLRSSGISPFQIQFFDEEGNTDSLITMQYGSGGCTLWSMCADPATGTIYVIAEFENGGGGTFDGQPLSLYTVDPSTGAMAQIADVSTSSPVSFIILGCFDTDDTDEIWSCRVHQSSPRTYDLIRINKTTGAVTTYQSNLGVDVNAFAFQAQPFLHRGELFLYYYGRVYHLEKTVSADTTTDLVVYSLASIYTYTAPTVWTGAFVRGMYSRRRA